MEELIKCTSHLEDGDTVEHDDNEAGKVGESEEGVDYEKWLQHSLAFQVALTGLFAKLEKESYATGT